MMWQTIAAALAIGLGAIGAGIAMGLANGRAYEALGRNPESGSTVRTNFILGLVFSETIVIYALVMGLLILLRQG